MPDDDVTTLEDLHEEQEDNLTEYPCPKCGEPQPYFVKRGMGWARCPECDTGFRVSDIPEEAKHLIKKVQYKKQTKKQEDTITITNSFDDENDDDEIPFDRPIPPWKILLDVLTTFKVKESAKNLIVGRAKRKPLSPPEVQKMLMDLKSGLQKGEISYVVEEYYVALQAEDEKRKQKSNINYNYNVDFYEDSYTPGIQQNSTQSRREPQINRMPWEIQRKVKNDKDTLTVQDFLKILNEREQKRRQEEEKHKLMEVIRGQQSEISELKHLIMNPPNQRNESQEMLKLLLSQQEASYKQSLQMMEKMQQLERKNNENLIKMLKEQASKQPVPVKTGEYNEDGARLIAESVQSATQVIQQNKPLQSTLKAIANVAQTPKSIEDNPVKRKIGGDVGILSELDASDLVVDDE